MTSAAPMSSFLVEWYQSELGALSAEDAAAALTRAGEGERTRPVVLVVVLVVPHDETSFAVFSAVDVQDVIRTCVRAGWPVDRISTDVGTWVGRPIRP